MNTMSKTVTAALLAILVVSSAAAADVKSDYDRAFDLSKRQSFRFSDQALRNPKDALAADEMASKRLRSAIQSNLTALGMQHMHRTSGARYLPCEILLPALRDSYEDTLAALNGADMIVTHPVAFSSYLLARQTRLPWAALALAPASLFSIHDPSVLSGLPFSERYARLGPGFQSALRSTVAFLLERDWKPFRKLEKELGLSRARNPLLWTPEAQLVLGLFSSVLASPQRDWPANSYAVGFPFFDHAHGNPPELEFLDRGEPPIVFTLGSAAVGAAGDFFQQSADAAQSLGQRAVLLVGRDPRNHSLGKLPSGVISVPYAPHVEIFPRASVIVYQGGIGTTGEAMRSGRPMLVVRYSHDQPDHAARLKRLGIARSLDPRRYTPGSAAHEIAALLRDSGYSRRAAQVAATVRKENGVQAACDLLTGLIAKSETRRHDAAGRSMTCERLS